MARRTARLSPFAVGRRSTWHVAPSQRPRPRLSGYAHQPDLSVAFLERALELAAPGGAIGLLLPSKFLSANYGEAARGKLEVSLEMDWRFRVALVIAHETGHRIGAIRQLRWSDIDLEGCIIRWRGEHEKTRYEHRTPVSAEALAALEEARRKNPGIGYAPLLPAVPLLHLMRRYLLSIIILGRVFHRTDHEEGRAQGRCRRAPFLDHHPTRSGTSSRT